MKRFILPLFFVTVLHGQVVTPYMFGLLKQANATNAQAWLQVTNQAPVVWQTTAVVPGVRTIGPAQRFQVTFSFGNTGLAITNIVFGWSNAASGVSISNVVTLAGGATNTITGPIMSPLSVFWMTNRTPSAAATVVPNSTIITLF